VAATWTARAQPTFRVGPSDDLDRIVALPRVPPPDRELVKALTNYLKKPKGQMTLLEVQARALEFLADFGGLLCMLPVGSGKTLISLLAGTVAEATRPVLVVPAKLREKTQSEANVYKEHWCITMPAVMSYEELGRVGRADFFEKYQPDLIVCDEAHKLSNPKAAVTRRFARYLEANENVKFAALTGTMADKSLKDFAHLAEWALGKTTPLPLVRQVLDEWCLAIDEDVHPTRRIEPGALKRLAGEPKDIDRERAVQVVSNRIAETPGVIVSASAFRDTPLEIRPVDPGLDSVELEALRKLREDWQTLDGQDVLDFKDQARIGKALAVGLDYRWDPPAPEEWRQARQAWGRIVREVTDLPVEQMPFDSEKAVRDAIMTGRLEYVSEEVGDGLEVLKRWLDIAPSFTPRPVAEWISDVALDFAKDWIRSGPPGIVWTPYIEFGRRLARETDCPYYGSQATDARTGKNIIQEPGGRSIIASVASVATGQNLQDRWARNLVIAPSSSGRTWEQLIGRTHRPGQTRKVLVDVFFSTEEQKKSWRKALANARFLHRLTGQEQKLLFASIPDEMQKEA
jgi:hypothetical protein